MLKKILIPIIILVVAVSAYFYYQYSTTPKLLTSSEKNLSSINVIVPTADGEKTYQITDKDKVSKLYKSVAASPIKWINKKPTTDTTLNVSTRYILEFNYSKGEKDIIYTETQDLFIFKFLKTVGSHGENGFFTADNLEIYNLVKSMIEPAQ